MMLALPLLLATVAGQSYFTPAEAEAIFGEGLSAYARGEFDEAEKSYLKLLERGYGGSDVLYNLGTTHLAQSELGEATLYLERAWREGARDPDLEANLTLARTRQLDDVVGAAAHSPLSARLTEAVPLRPVALVFASLWAAAFGVLILRRLLPSLRRPAVTGLATVLLIAAVPAGALVAVHAWRHANVREAVVLAPTLVVRELPDVSSKVSFEVHAGLKVRLMDAAGPFARIRLPNGVEGWADQQSLAAL